ncbi:hypothetical protein [Lysobacter sp. HA18]
MINLSLKQVAFLDRMAESEEDEETGFRILAARPDASLFFAALADRGFFSPNKNKGPTPSARQGFVHIPYWPALGYLEVCAKHAADQRDEALGRRILDTIFCVTTADAEPVDNYHTNREFAEIVANMPVGWIDDRLLAMVPRWLESRFDTGGVVVELTKLVRNLSASESQGAWQLAFGLIDECTALTVAGADDDGKVALRAEDYWVNELVTHSSVSLGRKIGNQICALFLARITEVYGVEDRRMSSPFYRPAIEDHSQNHDWSTLDNLFVVGLRDALLSWIEVDSDCAKLFVLELLQSNIGVAQRIGIYALNQRWDYLGSSYDDFLPHIKFSAENFHELYWLLKDHFGQLQLTARAATLRAIAISIAERDADADSAAKSEADFLNALAGQGFDDVEARRAELIARGAPVDAGEHPDFYIYSESFWGHGNSPFQPQELLAFVANGSFIQRVNDFSGDGDWRGPTLRGLVDGIADAVAMAPADFVPIIARTRELHWSYQYAVVNGFKKAWDDSERPFDAPLWHSIWGALLDFSVEALNADDVWDRNARQRDDLAPTARWLPSLIADFVRAVAANDERTLGLMFGETVLRVVTVLLERSEPMTPPTNDAMTAAINSERGRAIEAFFALALRHARERKKDVVGPALDWVSFETALDREFHAAALPSLEAVTLCAAYLANLLFLSEAWLQANIANVFPVEPDRLAAAKDGVAYARLNKRLYRLVREQGRIRRMLELPVTRDRSHEHLLQHVALGYLWGEELLNGELLAWLFEEGRVSDLATIAKLLGHMKDPAMDAIVVERVLAFWERCRDILEQGDDASGELGAALAGMSSYVTSLDARQLDLMRLAAPYAGRRRGYAFVEDLERFVPSYPHEVSELLGLALGGAIPDYDYQGRIARLLRALAQHGCRSDAARYADLLRHLQGMNDLYREFAA